MKIFKYFTIFLASAVLFTVQPARGESNERVRSSAGFLYFEGDVKIMLPGETRWQPVTGQMRVEPGSVIKTASDSFARLRLENIGEIDLNEETSFEVAGEATMEMFYGAMRTTVKDLTDEQLEIKTPVAVAAVRGTDFAVIYEEKDRSETEVYGGSVQVRDVTGENRIVVNENLLAITHKGQAPEIIGEITEIRELRWVHLQQRMEIFQNRRRLTAVETALRRNRGMLRAAEEEHREPIREKISRLRTEQSSLERKLQQGNTRLDEISRRYSQVIEENARARRRLIEERRQQIIQQRQKRLEEKREERRQRLEER